MLRRLQAQTHPKATLPICKIHPFILWDIYDWKHHLKPFGLGAAVKLLEEKGHSQNNLMTQQGEKLPQFRTRVVSQ